MIKVSLELEELDELLAVLRNNCSNPHNSAEELKYIYKRLSYLESAAKKGAGQRRE